MPPTRCDRSTKPDSKARTEERKLRPGAASYTVQRVASPPESWTTLPFRNAGVHPWSDKRDKNVGDRITVDNGPAGEYLAGVILTIGGGILVVIGFAVLIGAFCFIDCLRREAVPRTI